ncbi:DUF1822 family protein [Scytonema tolypothrichoides VB-61278]|nr:DUF1822 family protein [Scytonema tolypothrichoides VB-61278]
MFRCPSRRYLGNHPARLSRAKMPKQPFVQIILGTGRQIHLPENLQLIVLDESGATCLMAESTSADNSIQLEFSGQPGEPFSVKVALGDASITENVVM